MSLLIKLLSKRAGLTALTIGVNILTVAVSLWWNSQLSIVINTINTNSDIPVKAIIAAVAAIAVSMGMLYLLKICSGWTCETLAHDLRMGYAKHFTSITITEIENINAGEQLSMLQNEMCDVSVFLRDNLFTFADDLIKCLGTFLWLLWLDPRLTLLSNLPTVIIMWYTVYTSRVIGKAVSSSQQANAQMNGFADTLITLFPVLRLFDADPLIHDKYNMALEQWKNASILCETRRAKLMSLSALLSCMPLLLTLLVGGAQVIHGATAIGTLYVFINLSGYVSGVMMNLPGRIALFRRFSANMKRLEPYISADPQEVLNEYIG